MTGALIRQAVTIETNNSKSMVWSYDSSAVKLLRWSRCAGMTWLYDAVAVLADVGEPSWSPPTSKSLLRVSGLWQTDHGTTSTLLYDSDVVRCPLPASGVA
jgi:hypothetical protein